MMTLEKNNKGIQKSPIILDATLRDGSYVIDFQFSKEDTFKIAQKIDQLGFEYIEIGHGLGLGASKKKLGIAKCTDEEYLQAASEAVVNGKWGMFCIPNICDMNDLKLAVDYGMDFVRVGTEVDAVESGKPYIEFAKKHGLFVCCNLMKSYIASPSNFAAQALKCIELGADCVYIVDSAGGMLPDELLKYIEAIRRLDTKTMLGFHGHHNLGMSIANSLICAVNGVDIIDTTLQGMGRSLGNVPTSQFLAVLMRSGFEPKFDLVDVMLASEILIRPLIERKGFDTIDIVSGFAEFHSGLLPQVSKYAEEHNLEVRRLIIELCKLDKKTVNPTLLKKAAEQLLTQVANK